MLNNVFVGIIAVAAVVDLLREKEEQEVEDNIVSSFRVEARSLVARATNQVAYHGHQDAPAYLHGGR